jgi:FAD/FMN-containing dehydrogenase
LNASERSPGGARILEYEPGDLTVIVEAGMRLGELAAVLAACGQRLSLDPPGDPTLGECLLDDLSGPLRHRFGTMRDLILGVSVVLADGLRANSGGKVVKNVAGYDLGKLFCGSRGRLGSVQRLALRLHPLPRTARTVVIDASRWLELHRSQIVPSAVDLLGGELHVLLEGSPASVDGQLAVIGGEETDRWAEIRELQATLPGRRRWDPPSPQAGGEGTDDAPLVRPGPRIAYTAAAAPAAWSALAERVVEAMRSRSPEGAGEAMWTPS